MFKGFSINTKKPKIWTSEVFTALHVMHTRSSDENSVRPSVRTVRHMRAL